MRDKKIKVSRLKLAQVRFFDVSKNASEIPELKAYAFLVNVNGNYVNPFNPLEEVPVYERTPYSNTTKEGQSFGNKIRLVSGEVKDGICYIIENIDMDEIFKKETVSLGDIENYIFKSEKFFIDRLELSRDRKFTPNEVILKYRQFSDDTKKDLDFKKYLDRDNYYQKIKKD